MSKVKYLWTAALLALCVTVAGGAAFGQSWAVAGQNLPSAMIWDQAYAGSVDVQNTGAAPLTQAGYQLWSVEGTSAAVTLIDRWGIDYATLPADIPTGTTATVALSLTAPPITTLGSSTLECDWVLTQLPNTTLNPPLAEADVVISRFTDDQPGSLGAWARGPIEMCAGRVPIIVAGYGAGVFGPRIDVDRGQLAVFMCRAAKLALISPATPSFTDVGTGYWAYEEIETLVDAGIVHGYSDDTYHPEYTLKRDEMAVLVAHTAGYTMPTLTADPFLDVQIGYWADQEIQACVDNNVVSGYGDGYYRPRDTVSRDQMAVFMHKAFIMPTGQPIVVGGPDLTDFDPSAAGWDGFSSTRTDPTYAYVTFDTSKLDTNLCVGGTWDIDFEFLVGTGPTLAVPAVTVPVAPAAITGATGSYFLVSTAVPALPTGSYTLRVKVEDEAGTMQRVARRVAFTVS